jgi:aerobic carbon-monoxide dehydrogenase large subunit
MEDQSKFGHLRPRPPAPTGSGNSVSIGRRVARVEDERILRGGSRFVSDLIATSRALRVKVLRSPHAHARILGVDSTQARTRSGVVDVLVADDLTNVGDLPCDWVAPGMEVVPQHPILAGDRVRYAGQPIAAVAAETPQAAEDALANISVRYEVLDALVDQEAALAEHATRLHDALPDNVAFRFHRRGGDVERAFTEAETVIRRRLINNRVAAAPLEGRAVLSHFETSSGRLTHYSSSQLPHTHARSLGECLGLPLHKLRFVAPDIGGGFGAKLGFYSEDVLCAALSMRTGRACAWIEGRAESFLATTHGRDHIQYVELAAKRDGRMTGLRARILADLGAYALGMGPGVPAINTGTALTGCYNIPHVDVEIIGVYTNRTPTGPYRGAGHPEATFLIERMVDDLARELGRDPIDVRRANFVASSAMPHHLPTGLVLDSGDYAANMDAALAMADYAALRHEQQQLRAAGRYVGIGLATYAEATGAAPSIAMGAVGFRRAGHESARVVVHPDGRATLFSGAQSTGQGHTTSLAQIAASVLGIPLADIEVVEGDTQAVPFGTGTFNSRSMALGGSAVYEAARRIMLKATKIAAYKLQARPRDLVYENGVFRRNHDAGMMASIAHSTKRIAQRVIPVVFKRRTGFELPAMPRSANELAFTDIAREAHLAHDLPLGMAPGLDETYFFDPKDVTFDYGTHVAVVEVDPEIGHIALLRHVIVDDCGRIINPLLVDGQVHGGAAQGIGQALMEAVVHGVTGVPLVSGFSDYAMPHASDLPTFETGHTEVPTTANPLGVRGAGEGATIGATPAVVNAVLDALAPLGVTDIPMPMTPLRVWHAIERARQRLTASGDPRESRGPASVGEAIPGNAVWENRTDA